MRSHLTTCLFTLTLVSGCTDSGTDDVSQRNDVDEEECECKIEGNDIGRVGAAVKPPGHTTIRFQSWIEKPGSPGEYIGFTLWGDYAGATYVVKAGTSTYEVSGASSWTHPGGPGANAISNVDFCPDDYPDDGGGDDEPPPDGEPPPIL
jgi:hypothetical protein